ARGAVALHSVPTRRSSDLGAWKAGLADVCVPPRVMEAAARAVVMSGRHSRHLPWREVLKATLLRRFVAARARRALAPQLRADRRSEEHTSELQSRENLVCR